MTIDKIIIANTIKDSTPESTITQLLNIDINKTILKDYFDNTLPPNTPYKKTI